MDSNESFLELHCVLGRWMGARGYRVHKFWDFSGYQTCTEDLCFANSRNKQALICFLNQVNEHEQKIF